MRRLVAFIIGVLAVPATAVLASAGGGPADPLPTRAAIDAEVARLDRMAPAAQAAALADGEVSVAEYHAAIAARLACVRNGFAGLLEVVGPFAVANGRLLAWRYRVDGGPDPILADLDRRCGAAHSAAIERAHRLLAIPHGSERASQAKALRACLRRHGIAVSSSGLATLLRAANEADVPVGECLDRHAVLFGV